MAEAVWGAVATLAAGWSVALVARARGYVRHTTLGAAWGWTVIATGTWLVAAAAQWIFLVPPMRRDQLWYLAAVAGLCPWVAVLGARRPGVRVWNWFVLLPLTAVSMVWLPHGPSGLPLETPGLIVFGLVLLMGCGNFLGTQFTPTAILAAAAEGLVLASLIGSDSASAASRQLRGWAVLCLWIGTFLAVRPQPSGEERPRSWDRLWSDFRNTFGIVWANRIADRVNVQAAKEAWTVRLGPQGFFPAEGQPADTAAAESGKIDHALRWLLRRFVDDEWLDARAPAGTQSPESREAV